ncbi:phosphate ABC transporter permease PstA [Marispirochaeta aestuarii]|uniref:phosphate ABC transporter permease PstA n=1 Tax=Marispirochaeta aestuarii TaxID=1963862 RepID=UPI0029C878E5|nr:phosphate ABC transporter permease PstA [Marispirochaeta aestuarii]
MELSRSTRISKLEENIARGFVWLFAGLTIIILVWIVGYILFRGFYSRQYIPYDVLPIEETVIPLEGTDDQGLRIIVNRKIKIRDLTESQLNEIYSKRRRENWGFYTRQDLDVQPFALKAAPGSKEFADAAARAVLPEGKEFSKYTSFVSGFDEMADMVAKTPGAIGFVPSDYKGSLNRVKTVPLRRFSVFFSPGTVKIEKNKKLQELDQEKLQRIFQGTSKNWLELGGIDLEILPALYLYNDSFTDQLEDLVSVGSLEESGIPVFTDKDKYFDYIASTPGSIGIALYDEVHDRDLPSVPVIRKETGPNLTLSFLLEAPSRSGAWGGISYIIINTLLLIAFTLLFSTPVGVAAAIYLVEYARQGPLVRFLRMGTETLAGIPSIVFGLFGRIFFVQILGMGIGFLSATLTVTLMILPTIVRTSEEALSAVPGTYREGSLALGATKLDTIFKVVLPAASPGILTGIILGIGRVVGETAVLLYTLGSSYELVAGPSSPARVLSLHLYLLFSEAVSFDRAFATGTVLIFIILIVNRMTTRMIGRMNRMSGK